MSTARDSHDESDRTIHLSEERLDAQTETVESGRVRAVKRVDTEHVEQVEQRGVEHADVERGEVLEGDSGEVITLEDGSLSIPVFEEQLVVTKRLVVRERVVVRKHTVYEEHTVSADLRREELEVQTDGDVVVEESAPQR